MAEGGDSVDSGRKSGGTLDKIPDTSSLYLGPEEVGDSGRKVRVSLRDGLQDTSSLHLGPEGVEPVVCREHGQDFTHFCKAHMTELCSICRRMEHKDCKSVMDIKEAAGNTYSKIHDEKIIQSVEDLIERFKDFKATAEDLKTKCDGKRNFALQKLKQNRKDIDNYLDELDARAETESDQKLKKDINDKLEQIKVCEASLSSLSTNKSDIERAVLIGSEEEKFIAINRATKQTKLYCNMLYEMNRELSDMNVNFEPNVSFPDIFQSLGTMSVETSSVTHVFTDTTPTYTGEMKVKKHVKDGPPQVRVFDVLQDGRKLVLDDRNSKIQLYDKNNTFLTETVLPAKEGEQYISVVINSSTEALVTTARGKLFKVMIGNVLTLSEIITNYRFYTMTKCGEDLVCIVGGPKQLCVIDNNMEKIIKTILKDEGKMFSAPAFLRVSADKNTIYVLDCKKGCFGITLDGQIVFHYQNPEACRYDGIVVDSDGLFIGSRVQNKDQIEKLNFSGERKEVCTIFGNSHPLRMVEKELAVFQWDEASIRFYIMLK